MAAALCGIAPAGAAAACDAEACAEPRSGEPVHAARASVATHSAWSGTVRKTLLVIGRLVRWIVIRAS
jgi:hypothetical protein